MTCQYKFKVSNDKKGMRLDRYIKSEISDISRTYLQELIDDGSVLVNGQHSKKGQKIKKGDSIEVFLPEDKEIDLPAEDIHLDIIFEDSHLIIINKPAGMMVHPALGVNRGTLVNALLYHCDNLPAVNNKIRPGIVHRLDKDTTGLIAAAKTNTAYRKLLRFFKERNVKKDYLALVHGVIKEKKGEIDAPIGRSRENRTKMTVTSSNSRSALSSFLVLKRFKEHSLIKINIKTGRTHQIRVHMSYIDHPVVGDKKYGSQKNRFGVKRQLLHACMLGFRHPLTDEHLKFKAPPPPDFQNIINLLESNYNN